MHFWNGRKVGKTSRDSCSIETELSLSSNFWPMRIKGLTLLLREHKKGAERGPRRLYKSMENEKEILRHQQHKKTIAVIRELLGWTAEKFGLFATGQSGARGVSSTEMTSLVECRAHEWSMQPTSEKMFHVFSLSFFPPCGFYCSHLAIISRLLLLLAV